MEVHVTQYMRPNGRKVEVTTDLPDADGTLAGLYSDMVYAGCVFEAEVLTTGQVSVTISNGEEDIDISITQNGPEVHTGMIEMLKRRNWIRQSTPTTE